MTAASVTVEEAVACLPFVDDVCAVKFDDGSPSDDGRCDDGSLNVVEMPPHEAFVQFVATSASPAASTASGAEADVSINGRNHATAITSETKR